MQTILHFSDRLAYLFIWCGVYNKGGTWNIPRGGDTVHSFTDVHKTVIRQLAYHFLYGTNNHSDYNAPKKNCHI